MPKRKVLITGGDGVLAQYIKTTLSNYILLSTDHKSLDVTKKKLIDDFFRRSKPDIVVHLAAKTNVDECERNPQQAFSVNSEGTKNIAQACKIYRAFLIHISTAAVFDGKKEIYYEDDKKNPVNVYGKSKLLAEQYIENLLEKYLIIRAGWLIGGGKNEKKFVSYILDQIKNSKEIKVVDDKFGTITYAKELADIIKKFIKESKLGVYHYGSKGACSRFDIAKKIVEILRSDVDLIPVSSNYFSSKFSAPRPDREVIGSKKIEFPLTWQESLENYIANEILR